MSGQRGRPLEARQARRRPELGQHFLRDSGLAAELVRGSTVGPHDQVLELGAGSGLLTAALARVARRVVAVELDPHLAEALQWRWAGSQRVELLQADFMASPLPVFEGS